jgi:hypothetical protein
MGGVSAPICEAKMIKKIKKFFIKKIDNYIIKYHTGNYVHKNMLKEEISKHIKSAVFKNNQLRDEQEKEKLEAQKIKNDIELAGWLAELEHAEKIAKEMIEKNKRVTKLYYSTLETAKGIALIAAESKHETTKMMNNFAENIGTMEKISLNTENIVKGIETDQDKSEDIMGVKCDK